MAQDPTIPGAPPPGHYWRRGEYDEGPWVLAPIGDKYMRRTRSHHEATLHNYYAQRYGPAKVTTSPLCVECQALLDADGNCHECGERDPHGIDQHAPGAKLDASKNRLGLVIGGFSRALEAVGEVGTLGAAKYSDRGWERVPSGADRYTDALLRHLMAEFQGEERDAGLGTLHAAQAAWNALARLELILRSNEND